MHVLSRPSTWLASTLLVTGAAPAQEDAPPVLEIDGRALVRREARANDFTRSAQDAVGLSADAAGGAVLTWQSRRQQEGTYGVYARRFAPDGAAASPEVQVNATTGSHQMQPVVAVDEAGCAWFAWRSFGQDGSLGTIVARRFDPSLGAATAEVIVNDEPAGHQTDPAVAVLPGGGALVAWLDPGEGEARAVRARRLTADGGLDGPAFPVSAAEADHRTPAMAALPDGRVAIAYARVDGEGRPAGVWLRTLEAGELSDERRVDVARDVHAVEPTLAAGADGFLLGWLEREEAGYGLRVRTLADDLLGPIREVDVEGEGWVSGLTLAADGAGGGLAAWNRHADGPRREAGLWARRLDARTGRAAGEAFRVTARSEGPQAIPVAAAGGRCALLADGRMLVAWQGDAGLGDDSAAHLTLLAPEGARLATAGSAPAAPAPGDGNGDDDDVFGDPAAGLAQPTHEPPTFDPRRIERDRDEDAGPASGGGVFDFLAFTSTGWVPPDPEMGVGPDHVVVMVNGGIAWLRKDGTLEFQQDINGANGFWGSVGASGFVFDPEVVFDVHSQRFFAFASDANNGFVLAVSDDADPNGTWHKYLIDTSTFFGTNFVDSGNLAVDEDFVSLTGDLFSPDRLGMLFIDKASATSGGPLVITPGLIAGRHSLGTCTNQDAGGQPLFLTWAEEFTSSTTLTLYAVTDRATVPQAQSTTLTVPTYAHPTDPPQQGTSVRPELFEARFWSSMVVGGQLWAVHHEGNPARVQWYQIDLGNWPASGSPTLVQSGEVTPGGDVFTFFPSIWADAAGNAAITYNRSSSSEFISIEMVCRDAGDPLGQMRAPLRVRDGTSPDDSGRFGDYSATNTDPVQPGAFWGHHEYRGQSNWRTRVARIELCDGGAVNYCTTSSNSAGPGAVMGNSGSVSIGANDLVLEVTGAPPGQFGLFFFGDSQQSSSLGDGTLCVGGTLHRFPVVTVDGAGGATFAPDLQNLPGGVTLSPGDVQNFQFWYRDPNFGNTGFNLSDGLEVTFCN